MNTARKFKHIIDQSSVKFFVDIGASNDIRESQTEFLLSEGWQGVAFEGDLEKATGLQRRLPSLKVVNGFVTPENVLNLFEKHEVPKKGFYLSLDIDGYDYHVLTAILQEYKPDVVISEINEKIPTPIRFSVKYSPSYHWDGSHFYGYSIMMAEDFLRYGYAIHDLDFNNVILLSSGYKAIIADSIPRKDMALRAYERGYKNKPGRREFFPWNADMDHLLEIDTDKVREFLRNKFSAKRGFYELD